MTTSLTQSERASWTAYQAVPNHIRATLHSLARHHSHDWSTLPWTSGPRAIARSLRNAPSWMPRGITAPATLAPHTTGTGRLKWELDAHGVVLDVRRPEPMGSSSECVLRARVDHDGLLVTVVRADRTEVRHLAALHDALQAVGEHPRSGVTHRDVTMAIRELAERSGCSAEWAAYREATRGWRVAQRAGVDLRFDATADEIQAALEASEDVALSIALAHWGVSIAALDLPTDVRPFAAQVEVAS